MAITKDDIVIGQRLSIKNNTRLENGPNLIVMNEKCHALDGLGELEPGAVITITAPLDNRAVRTAETVEFTIDGEGDEKYTTFWSFLKPRANILDDE